MPKNKKGGWQTMPDGTKVRVREVKEVKPAKVLGSVKKKRK